MQKRLLVFLLTFSVLSALMLPLSALLPSSDDVGLYDKIIRLHVLAASDSEADQRLKLTVRDGILEAVSELMSGVTTKTEAEAVLRENLGVIEAKARAVLKENCSGHTVSVTLTKENYPTRQYESITLPAGEYTSLRVLIGEAEGKNWWCVLFPKLCVTPMSEAVVSDDNELIAAGLTPSQVKIITKSSPDVVVKFRILELFREWF